VIAIVRAGAVVELTLPRREWRSVGLLYDPSKFRSDGTYRVRDLARSVEFRSCRQKSFNHGVSQFDGGFVVSRRQCVRFLVASGGKTYAGEFPAAASCRNGRQTVR
jgi:hypothetical protein